MSDQSNIKPPGFDYENKRVAFDYIKSPHFRTIVAEGIFGGISPRGRINMAIWNERWPIPKQSVQEIGKKNELGKEIIEERVSRDAVIREVDVMLSLDVTTAIQMRDWLNDKLGDIDSLTEEAPEG